MEFIQNLTVKDIIQMAIPVIAFVSYIIEINKKLPFKPLSAIFRWIGAKTNKELTDKVDDLATMQLEMSMKMHQNSDNIIALEDKFMGELKGHFKDDDEREARKIRRDIIMFCDSLRAGEKCTRGMFEENFRAIDDYYMYIARHNTPNHFIDEEVRFIREVYSKRLKDNDFL